MDESFCGVVQKGDDVNVDKWCGVESSSSKNESVHHARSCLPVYLFCCNGPPWSYSFHVNLVFVEVRDGIDILSSYRGNCFHKQENDHSS